MRYPEYEAVKYGRGVPTLHWYLLLGAFHDHSHGRQNFNTSQRHRSWKRNQRFYRINGISKYVIVGSANVLDSAIEKSINISLNHNSWQANYWVNCASGIQKLRQLETGWIIKKCGRSIIEWQGLLGLERSWRWGPNRPRNADSAPLETVLISNVESCEDETERKERLFLQSNRPISQTFEAW